MEDDYLAWCSLFFALLSIDYFNKNAAFMINEEIPTDIKIFYFFCTSSNISNLNIPINV